MQCAEQDDRSLLERIQRGDRLAIASLYDRYASILYSMALRFLGNVELAEKVVSDVFVDIWQRPHSLTRSSGNLASPIVLLTRDRVVAMLRSEAPAAIESTSALEKWLELRVVRREKLCTTDQLPVVEHVQDDLAEPCGISASTSPLTTAVSGIERDAIEDSAASRLSGTGLEVIEIERNEVFRHRRLRTHDPVLQIQGMNRLALAFAGDPAKVLQELAAAAVDLCGADSAGISIVESNSTDDNFYHWVAAAGQYSGFLGARLPRYPSACGVTLERDSPQQFRVSQKFFDLMGIQAPTVTDGLLLPWHCEETCGTIWIMAHGRDEAFDVEDCRIMQALANFAATGVRLQQQQMKLLEQARAEAEAATADRIVRQIDSPLRGLIQTVYLFERGDMEGEPFARRAMGDLSKLSEVIQKERCLPN